MKIITAIKSWLFREKHSAHHWRKYLSETSLLGCRDTKTPAGRLGLMRPTMGVRGLCGQAGGQNLCSTWAGCVLPAPVRPLGFCPPLAPSCWQPVGQPCHQAPSTPRPGPHAGAAVERLWCAQRLQFMMNALNGGLRDGLAGQGAGWHSLVLRRQCLLILPRQP